MKNKYIAHNLHKINKPEMIEKVSFTMSYLKIYQYTAYPPGSVPQNTSPLKRKNIAGKFKSPLDIRQKPRYIQDTP